MNLTPEEQDFIKRIQSRSTSAPQIPQEHGIDLTFGNPTLQGIGNTIKSVLPSRLPYYGKASTEQDSALDTAIKYNQLQTGTPEFKMREAQARADIELQKGLDLERAKKEQAQADYDAALAAEGNQSQSVSKSPSIPSGVQIPQSGPSMPTAMPEKTGGVPRFITINSREYDKDARRFIDKPTIKDNPEWESLNKPLAGEQATKFAGATQAKQSVSDIMKALKISPTGNTTSYGKPEYKSEVPVHKRIIDKIQQDAAGSTGLIMGKNVPIISDVLRAPQLFADQEARDLDAEYNTLAENLLRSRTGAAAPEPEIVREMARTFNRLGDNPTTVANRLLNDEEFVDNIIESIRPGYLRSLGLVRGSDRQTPTELPNAQNDNLPPELQALVAKGIKVTRNG